MNESAMKQKTDLKSQLKLTFLLLLAELPNFVAVTGSAIISKSLLVWMDFLDCACNLLQTILVIALAIGISRNLKYKYNYGVGKIEAIVSLFCDGIEFLGLLLMIGLSINSFINPAKPSGFLILVVGMKMINVGFDIAFLIPQAKIRKKNKGKVVESSYAAAIGALIFDAVALFSILIVWLLRNAEWSYYISPTITIGFAIVLIYFCFKRFRKSLGELTDVTLPEKEQMEILKIIVKYINYYEEFHSVKSRVIGQSVHIDLLFSFSDDTTYETLVDLKNKIQVDLEQIIESCEVNIVIQ